MALWRAIGTHERNLPGRSNLAEVLHLQLQVCPAREKTVVYFLSIHVSSEQMHLLSTLFLPQKTHLCCGLVT